MKFKILGAIALLIATNVHADTSTQKELTDAIDNMARDCILLLGGASSCSIDVSPGKSTLRAYCFLTISELIVKLDADSLTKFIILTNYTEGIDKFKQQAEKNPSKDCTAIKQIYASKELVAIAAFADRKKHQTQQ